MYSQYYHIIDSTLEFLNSIKIPTPLVCDHICYRVTSLEKYYIAKEEALKISSLVTETIVRGRPISIFKFHTPINYKGLVIKSLELPAPKEGSPYKEGFEHLEFVVNNLQALIKNNTHIEFDLSGSNRELNPEVALAISSDYNVKFHPLDILDVIAIEEKANITEVK
ncbi:VOC family protein [Bacteriovorax sp. Seq25_V]|uniref:VOC family protein n=1 Tax=Bacteriovorax sp. Seq25_V TaxID=1201288 RepID=UPI00038A54AC|nr:VOC family protein [Bacteriovorax sp. Seq25_V]EQC46617.1 YecM domain protein [Bacteriovorax sp. Seq25_V]